MIFVLAGNYGEYSNFLRYLHNHSIMLCNGSDIRYVHDINGLMGFRGEPNRYICIGTWETHGGVNRFFDALITSGIREISRYEIINEYRERGGSPPQRHDFIDKKSVKMLYMMSTWGRDQHTMNKSDNR